MSNIFRVLWKSGPIGKFSVLCFLLLFVFSFIEVISTIFFGTTLSDVCEFIPKTVSMASLSPPDRPSN